MTSLFPIGTESRDCSTPRRADVDDPGCGEVPVRVPSPYDNENLGASEAAMDQTRATTSAVHLCSADGSTPPAVHLADSASPLEHHETMQAVHEASDVGDSPLPTGSNIVVDVPDTSSHLHLHLHLHYDKDADVPQVNISTYDRQMYINESDGLPPLEHGDLRDFEERCSGETSGLPDIGGASLQGQPNQSPFQTVDQRRVDSTPREDPRTKDGLVPIDVGGRHGRRARDQARRSRLPGCH